MIHFDIEFGIQFRYFKGGGGGGSGAVSYPAYMQGIHEDWLDDTGGDAISSSVTAIMNAALGNSPWTGETAYDPDADLVNLIAAPNAFQTLVTLLSTGTGVDALIAGVLDDTRIDNVVTEYAADMDARLNAEVIPRFEAGMRDINAVSSSAFALGLALIEENQDRQIAKFAAELHLKSFSDDALKVVMMKLEYQKAVSQMLAEAYRIKIVAKKEETDSNLKIGESDATWDLEVFKYGGNLLASIGGGTAGDVKTPSTAQSVIGGAMSGAAAGAMMSGGNPYVTAGGAFLGAASALM